MIAGASGPRPLRQHPARTPEGRNRTLERTTLGGRERIPGGAFSRGPWSRRTDGGLFSGTLEAWTPSPRPAGRRVAVPKEAAPRRRALCRRRRRRRGRRAPGRRRAPRVGRGGRGRDRPRPRRRRRRTCWRSQGGRGGRRGSARSRRRLPSRRRPSAPPLLGSNVAGASGGSRGARGVERGEGGGGGASARRMGLEVLGEREEEAARLEARRRARARGGADERTKREEEAFSRGGESSHAADAERRWRAAEAREATRGRGWASRTTSSSTTDDLTGRSSDV